MRFPNAAKGISKIFTSEILSLIAILAAGVAGIVGTVFYTTAESNNEVGTLTSGIGFLVLAVGASVVTIIALILKIVGVIQASKDEDSFKMIIYITIFTLIVAIIAAFFSNVTFIYNISNAITNIGEFVTSLLIIIGIGNLAMKMNNVEIINKCGTQFKLILWIGIISLLTRFFSIFLPTFAAQSIVIVLAVIGMILGIIQYILYLSLLSKTKKMLNNQ